MKGALTGNYIIPKIFKKILNMPYMKQVVFCLICIWSFSSLYAQTYIPGESYSDSTGFVEYKAGRLPIIISAPHGGNLEPDSIPDRSCSGCITLKDSWTKTISEGLYNTIHEITGCYPHLIINLLHRKKFDANRDIADAADGNATVEQAWFEYHRFIDSAKANVKQRHGRGLFLDMHGHGHTIQRIELGYLLSSTELQQADSMLNTPPFIQESSIRTLISDNINGESHSMLVRGGNSFGTLLNNKGFSSVPSFSDPYPKSSEPYFSGGFNTKRHGSRDNQGKIDAIQIELNQSIRFNDSTRNVLIDSLAHVALDYYNLHYDRTFFADVCQSVGVFENKDESFDITLYPNPAEKSFRITSKLSDFNVHLYNTQGQLLLTKEISSSEKIRIGELAKGLYFVQIFNEGTPLSLKKVFVK